VFRKTIVALVIAVAALAVPAALASPAAESAAAFKTQNDPSGDGGAAPDITEVQVGNDVVAGPIVMWITLANRESFGGGDLLFLYLDTDLNPSTGGVDFAGADHAIGISSDAALLFRWDGASFAQMPAPSLEADFFKSEKAIRISLQPTDLGGTRGFNFYLVSRNGDSRDFAPDGAAIWSYSLTSGQVVLTVEDFAVSPKAPRAGKRFAAAIQVGRDDINEILDSGKVTCRLRVGTKTVRAASARFADGVAVCSWNLPKTAKGQTIRGTIAVTFAGVTVTRAFSARVR
jgi:hypothetical protein